MSNITNYQEGRSCQINLDDNSKILVSLAYSEIKIFLLNFIGFPKETLYTFDIDSINILFSDVKDVLKGKSLKDIANRLSKLSKKEDVVDACNSENIILKRLYPPLK